jgi:phage terminase large subunit GpA-like protein
LGLLTIMGFILDARVLALTLGGDVQDDRIGITILGHARDGTIFVLDVVIYGSPFDDDLWAEVEKILRQRFAHSSGGALKIDAAAIDVGDGGHFDAVLRFCNARMGRRPVRNDDSTPV